MLLQVPYLYHLSRPGKDALSGLEKTFKALSSPHPFEAFDKKSFHPVINFIYWQAIRKKIGCLPMRLKSGFLVVLLLSACTGQVQHTEQSGKNAPQQEVQAAQDSSINPFKRLFLGGLGGNDAHAPREYASYQAKTGLKAQGMASWYGARFHQRRTSSGERYDMNGYSAAHKTLPLPSYVKVKNLDNGRETIVRINDRGPYRGDRVVDVSYAAAKDLGLMPKGVARVEIEALVPKAERTKYFYIHLDGYRSAAMAERIRSQIRKWSTSPAYVENHWGSHSVLVGPFAYQNTASSLAYHLKRRGIVAKSEVRRG